MRDFIQDSAEFDTSLRRLLQNQNSHRTYHDRLSYVYEVVCNHNQSVTTTITMDRIAIFEARLTPFAMW